MSLFPRGLGGEFTPLFRLLDDYATHSAHRGGFPSAVSSMRSFTPKFDVKETKDAYELHGELPGIEQKNISIEFTDPSTIQITGRTEHRRTRGQPPAGFVEGEQQQQQQQIEGGYHKPTVEEEQPSESTQVQKSDSKDVDKKDKQEEGGDGSRYWVTERSVGEFNRSFTFPSRVDQDKVKASLKDGILSIVVPKASAPQTRKIDIQ